ncbi:hypothetical protein Tco_0377829 [Tanacetum coccineum]
MGDGPSLALFQLMVSDKLIKSSVENIVPIPSESEDFSDIENPHHFNVESDLIESLLYQDTSITSSPKIDSLLEEFSDELAHINLIPPGINEADFNTEEDICLVEKLLYDNSSPRPPKEFNSKILLLLRFASAICLIEDPYCVLPRRDSVHFISWLRFVSRIGCVLSKVLHCDLLLAFCNSEWKLQEREFKLGKDGIVSDTVTSKGALCEDFHGMDDTKEIWEIHQKLDLCPPAWCQAAMTIGTKPDVDTLSIDVCTITLESLSRGKIHALPQKNIFKVLKNGAFVSQAKHHSIRQMKYMKRSKSLKDIRRKNRHESCKRKEQLQKNIRIHGKISSKKFWRLINSGMSSNSKVGLGYEIQSNNEVLSYEEEINFSVFNCSKEDSVGKPLYSRFTKTNDFKGIPHPLSGDYTPIPQEEIDESLYIYGKKGPQEPEPNVSDDRSNEYSYCQSNGTVQDQIGIPLNHSVGA